MENKNINIDNLFKSKIHSYSEEPSELVWEKINKSLDLKKNNDSKIIWIFKVAAAAVILAFVTGIWIGNTHQSSYTNIADNSNLIIDNTPINNNTAQLVSNTRNKTQENKSSSDESLKLATTKTKAKQNPKQAHRSKVIKHKKIIESSNTKTLNKNQVKNKTHLLKTIGFKKLRTFIESKFINKRDLNAFTPEKNLLALSTDVNRGFKPNWSVSGNFGTGLSSSSEPQTESLPMAESTNNFKSNINSDPSTSQSIQSYKGGVNFEYNFAKNLSLETGLSLSNFGQNSSGINSFTANSISSTISKQPNNNIETSAGNVNVALSPSQSNKDYSLESDNGNQLNVNSFDIDQTFNYLSIPICLSYRVLNKGLQINLKGGINNNFLLSNEAKVTSNDNSTSTITEGLRNFVVSGDISLKFNYPISKHLKINLQPSFEFYLNTLNSNTDHYYKPQILTITTGITYTIW